MLLDKAYLLQSFYHSSIVVGHCVIESEIKCEWMVCHLASRYIQFDVSQEEHNILLHPFIFRCMAIYCNLVYSTRSKPNLNRFNFNQSIIDSFINSWINSWADIMNRADLGMEVMHEINPHHFPLDLALA